MRLQFKSSTGLTYGGEPLDKKIKPWVKVTLKLDDGNLIRLKCESRLSADGSPVVLAQVKENLHYRSTEKVIDNQQEVDDNNKERKLAKEKGEHLPDRIQKKFKHTKKFSGQKIPDSIKNPIDKARYVYLKIVRADIIEKHPSQKGNIDIII